MTCCVRGLAGVALVALTGCTTLFPFEECASDDDCPASRSLCDGAICTDRITADTTWSPADAPVLRGPVRVAEGADLTIEPGTVVLGEPGSALLVMPGSRLLAAGTADRPIVFTSAAAEREPGDWAGVSLLGRAPVNGGTAVLDGVGTGDQPPVFGGDAPESNCGTLRYVRVEFAGSTAAQGRAQGGLTLAGCGRGTAVDHVQVHLSADDGVEILGGTVDLHHIVVTRPFDDGLDYGAGWSGGLAYLAVQRDLTRSSADPSGIEASAVPDYDPDPASDAARIDPLIYNVTLVGGCPAPADCPDFGPVSGLSPGAGVRFAGDAGGEIGNALLLDWQTGVTVADVGTVENIEGAESLVRLGPTIIRVPPGGGVGNPRLEDAGGFATATWIAGLDPVAVWPSSQALGFSDDIGARDRPAWVPMADPELAGGMARQNPRFPGGGVSGHLGAFEPDGADWTAGWTAYPEQ